MPNHFLGTPQPSPENKCSDCLLMKLEGIVIEPEKPGIFNLKPKSAATEQIKLLLSLRFSEHLEPLLGGRIKFGLKGGELSLKLKNCTISLPSGALGKSFKLSVKALPKDKKRQQSDTNQGGVEDSLIEMKLGNQANIAQNETAKITDSRLISCQITTKGSEESLAWVFALKTVKTDEPILQGMIRNAILATINVTAKPCRIEAIFSVSAEDVYITEAEGLWPENISKKRKIVIQRAIVHRLLKRKLKPYLSRQELRFDTPRSEETGILKNTKP
ncbi:MAG: hypothetical protein U7123_04030 [Potamolinea sp.]